MLSHRPLRLSVVFLFCCTLIPGSVYCSAQESHYFVKPVNQLVPMANSNQTDSSLRNFRSWRNSEFSYAVIDQPGEVLVAVDLDRRWDDRQPPRLAIMLSDPADVTGTVYIPDEFDGKLKSHEFKISAADFSVEGREAFLRAKNDHYRHLLNEQLLGAAWFRYQANQAATELGDSPVADETRAVRPGRDELQDTMALISGGRALSENIQLDRILQLRESEQTPSIDIDEISGITVREFDWSELTKGIDPELDSLARLIPEDQHVAFLPNFAALVTLIETGFENASPLQALVENDSAGARTQERYQQQLALPMGEVQKALGPALIKSIAITGGDPYFRTGTDVAVIFETGSEAALHSAVVAMAVMEAEKHPNVETLEGEINGVRYTGHRTPSRQLCSYRAQLDGKVVVANSPVQLERIIATVQGNMKSIAELDEYKFFRHRYATDENETALIVISDAAIRRWCGPRWRIATSRRTQATAILSNLHAQFIDDMVVGVTEPIKIQLGTSVHDLSAFEISYFGAKSSQYGTLEFQTPISELDFEKVTEAERQAYELWRNRYQANWNNVFDPIAIRVASQHQRLSVDVTVMPLIERSQYNEMINVSLGSELDPSDLDLHGDALVHAALSLNPESDTLKQYTSFANVFVRGNVLDWLGESLEIYIDDDPLWKELAESDPYDDSFTFYEENLHRLPIAIRLDVRNGLKLTAFLAALRTFIDEAAPDMTVWETRRHQEQPYVRIGPSERAKRDMPEEIAETDLALYYTASGDSFVVSLSEALIQRSIDRDLKREASREDGETESAESVNRAVPMEGKNFFVAMHRRAAAALLQMWEQEYQRQMQRRAWAPIPILNEWKRRYPERDPLAVDQNVWKREIIAPSDSQYQWNQQWQTMESTVYGHPGEPKLGPPGNQLLGPWQKGLFGLTFENDGLRANIDLSAAADN